MSDALTAGWTADALECVFHKALSEGDARGVEAALTLMAPKDPRRAQRLYDEMKLALRLAASQRLVPLENTE